MEKRCANAHILIYNIVFELISAASTFFAFYFCVRDFFSSNITFASFMQFFTQSVSVHVCSAYFLWPSTNQKVNKLYVSMSSRSRWCVGVNKSSKKLYYKACNNNNK